MILNILILCIFTTKNRPINFAEMKIKIREN